MPESHDQSPSESVRQPGRLGTVARVREPRWLSVPRFRVVWPCRALSEDVILPCFGERRDAAGCPPRQFDDVSTGSSLGSAILSRCYIRSFLATSCWETAHDGMVR